MGVVTKPTLQIETADFDVDSQERYPSVVDGRRNGRGKLNILQIECNDIRHRLLRCINVLMSTSGWSAVKVYPTTGKLTGEMELRLQKVVEEARQDERTLFRLESFVPAGGSPGLDLGNSEKTLQYINNRLVELGIPQRRILVSSFGAEHDLQRDPTRHWVEIYLGAALFGRSLVASRRHFEVIDRWCPSIVALAFLALVKDHVVLEVAAGAK